MGCGSSSSTATDSDNKPKKKGGVEKLDIKKTEIEDLDKTFEEAAEPFNKAVDVKEQFDQVVANFKEVAGYSKEDAIKDVVIGLKNNFPELTIEIEDGPKFVLKLGQPGSDEKVNVVEKLDETWKSINDLLTKIIELVKTAVESSEALIARAQEFEDMVKNAGLSPLKIPKTLKNTVHNVSEFKKVPEIGKAFKQTIEDITEDIKNTVEALKSEP
ncbi:uncharacterized protein PF3D7_1120000-like [Ptychodera flava]|uniref:uncharacterized protein PF3D7_1120000-like n=1 Tax=Ptychodera flava TaxID=63121 RepID=UPI003969CBC9